VVAVEAPAVRYPSTRPDYPIASRPRQPHRAVFSGYWLTMSTEIISVNGDVDATNAGALTEYALGDVKGRHGMILDLRGVNFMGIEGFPALHRISVCCAAAGTHWAMVAGPAVSLVLAICDPEGVLPCSGTMKAAVTSI
jgi:anti-anti-sigma regulatory factor